MTFQQILDLAASRLRNTRAAIPPIADDDVDVWLVDKLSEDQPCGLETPHGSKLYGVVQYEHDEYTPTEARWLAAALLRAADEAEK